MEESTKEDRIRSCVLFLIKKKYKSFEDFTETYLKTIRSFKVGLSKAQVYNEYIKLVEEKKDRVNPDFEHFCVIKTTRSDAGVCVISTIMAPEFKFNNGAKGKFTCKYDCAFCPNDPQQARSYPRDEPVPLRGSQNDFDVIRQAHSRMEVLAGLNHPVDKLEWIVLGGTWSSYPKEYRYRYHAEIFFAANLWSEGVNSCQICRGLTDRSTWREHVRPIGTIEEEQELNRKSKCRIIGITIETRPDEINLSELRFIRTLGCTRIQMGFQHTDNEILKKNKRGCTIEQCKEGVKLCLDNGFKIDGHWMPDLPGSSPEKDRQMIIQAFTDPDLRCDQVKLYPTQVLDFTKIKKWYDEGTYKPYAETDFNALLELLIFAKKIMPPWVRTNRIVRDFPSKIVLGGLRCLHLHGVILQNLEKRGIQCQCIRCRQYKRQRLDMSKSKLIVRDYDSSDGREFFISVESESVDGKTLLLGFCRLRLKNIEKENQFSELHDCALIRELHVYGKTTKSGDDYVQHRGIGKRLLEKAEEIAMYYDWEKIAVISGIGVQDYYLSRGYKDGFYMVKELVKERKPCPYMFEKPLEIDDQVSFLDLFF